MFVEGNKNDCEIPTCESYVNNSGTLSHIKIFEYNKFRLFNMHLRNSTPF